MILPDVFQRFTERSPLSVMAQGAMEYALSESDLNQVFEEHAEDQYTRQLLFANVFVSVARILHRRKLQNT